MIVTLTGPTCAGKSTVEAALQKLGFGRAISHTTRLPRAQEVNGESYHFVSDAEYERLERAGKFIEVVKFGSAQYAMSADALIAAQQQSEHVVIVVEPHGCAQIHAFCKEQGLPSYAVWVDCHPKEQAQRWIKRLLNDAYSGKDVAGPYSERLHTMLTEEANWRMMKQATLAIYSADTNAKEYDLTLDSTEAPPEFLASVVMGRVIG